MTANMQLVDAIESTEPRYHFLMAALERPWPHGQRIGVWLIPLLLCLLAALSAVTPGSAVTTHNILHHLNFLPLMMAGMLFGLRGAAFAAMLAAVINAPGIAWHWQEWPLDATDQVVELAIFSTAGLIAGYLADREREHRDTLERTRAELEHVYLELQANVAAMKKAERLSAAGQLAASLAHEIRNPLASISGAAGILQRGAARPEYLRDSLEIIQKESQRLNTLLTGFLNFAKPRSPRLQRTELNALIQSVVSLALHTAHDHGIGVEYTQNDNIHEIACDPEQLRQVLLNLVINAIDASSEEATIHIRARLRAGQIEIDVEDRGSGVSEEASEHIFEPFFTTKAKGTGLGLAVSSMIISQHNGKLSFHANPEGGSTFRIELPYTQEAASAR